MNLMMRVDFCRLKKFCQKIIVKNIFLINIYRKFSRDADITVFDIRLPYKDRGQIREGTRYYVSVEDNDKLNDQLSSMLKNKQFNLFGDMKALGDEPKRQTYHVKYKLSEFDNMVNKIRDRYGEDEPIFYRSEKELRELLAMSHQTLNKVLLIAKRDGVIALPRRKGRRIAYYTREEIIAAILHIRDIREKGGGFG